MSGDDLNLDYERIALVARSWIGVPYRHASASKERGIDCVQLVLEVGKAVGVTGIPSLPPYRQINSPRHMLKMIRFFGREIPPQPGAVIYWGRREGVPTHFGVQTVLDGDFAVIHADAQLGRVVEHRFPLEQQSLIHSYWWFK